MTLRLQSDCSGGETGERRVPFKVTCSMKFGGTYRTLMEGNQVFQLRSAVRVPCKRPDTVLVTLSLVIKRAKCAQVVPSIC